MGYQIRLIDGMDSAIASIVFLDEHHVASVSVLGRIYVSEISNSKIVTSTSLDFRKNEYPSFVTRITDRVIAIGGTLGSLFFATLTNENKLEITKKLTPENGSNEPVLMVNWDESSNGFCSILG